MPLPARRFVSHWQFLSLQVPLERHTPTWHVVAERDDLPGRELELATARPSYMCGRIAVCSELCHRVEFFGDLLSMPKSQLEFSPGRLRCRREPPAAPWSDLSRMLGHSGAPHSGPPARVNVSSALAARNPHSTKESDARKRLIVPPHKLPQAVGRKGPAKPLVRESKRQLWRVSHAKHIPVPAQRLNQPVV
jgi:hypothetical protein